MSFNIADGAVKGMNLGALARSAESALKGDFNAIDLDKVDNRNRLSNILSIGSNENLDDYYMQQVGYKPVKVAISNTNILQAPN